MKYAFLVLLSFSCWMNSFAQQGAAAKEMAAKDPLVQPLLGTWVLDLRPSPEAPAYLKDFVVQAFTADALKGVFYDTPFNNGRIHTAWGKLYFAFTTADGSGTYYHSGYLEGGKLYGMSFSPARQFVLPWTGVRKP